MKVSEPRIALPANKVSVHHSRSSAFIEPELLYVTPVPLSNWLAQELDLNVGNFTYAELVSDKKRQEQLANILRGDNLNELGKKMKDLINGRAFVDIGCGIPTISFMPRVVAQLFGATKYVGVDLKHVNKGHIENEFPVFGDFKSSFFRTDLSTYLQHIAKKLGGDSQKIPVLFYLSGIQSQHRNNPSRKQEVDALCTQILTNINDVTVPGDGIILGPKTSGFIPEEYGFNCVYGYRKNRKGAALDSPCFHSVYIKK